jgi:hypothetical protein
MIDTVLKIVAKTGTPLFLAAFASAWFLGGDALNGKAVDGRYFVWGHGTYTEVSHAAFVFSTCITFAGFGGFGLAVLAAIIWARRNSNRPVNQPPSSVDSTGPFD